MRRGKGEDYSSHRTEGRGSEKRKRGRPIAVIGQKEEGREKRKRGRLQQS